MVHLTYSPSMASQSMRSAVLVLIALVWVCEWVQVRAVIFADSQQPCCSESKEEAKSDKFQLDSLPCCGAVAPLEVAILFNESIDLAAHSYAVSESSSHQLRGPPADWC